MTGVAVHAVINIVSNTRVFLIHGGFIVGMTVSTAEQRIIRRIGMAIIAGGPFPSMCPRINWEFVVEGCPCPGRRRMTGLTGLGETGGKVVRIAHRFINSSVATVAIHGRSRVSPTDVTTHTSDGSVGPSQWEAGLAMIKNRSFPLSGAMAGLTILRESGSGVIRIGCGIEVLQMASNTRGAQPGVFAAAMAVVASERNVGSRQWKFGLRMIKFGSRPGCRRVT